MLAEMDERHGGEVNVVTRSALLDFLRMVSNARGAADIAKLETDLSTIMGAGNDPIRTVDLTRSVLRFFLVVSQFEIRVRPKAHLTSRRSPAGESRDQAGTYVNLITSSPIRLLCTRRSGRRGPTKSGCT